MTQSEGAKLDARRGYLDHLARFDCDVRARVKADVGGFSIDGDTADEAGSLALNELALELGAPVRVTGRSQHHSGKVFRPPAANTVGKVRA
jgi:hypothetical protein